MPNPADYQSKDDFMGACVPMMMHEHGGMQNDQAVAACTNMWEKKSLPAEQDGDILVADGGEIKALGEGRVAGYLVRFTTSKDPDLTGEFFDGETDYGNHSETDIYYNHGLDAKMGKTVIGTGTLKRDEVGIWVDAQLEQRDEYEKAIYDLAKAGKLGWSSGTASHLVIREDGRIKRWVLGFDASLTPTPAEPRNSVIPLKSLQTLQADMSVSGDKAEVKHEEPANEPAKEPDMDENSIKTLLDAQTESLKSVIKDEAKAAVKEELAALPEIKAAMNVQVVKDEADQPFKSSGEFFMAVKAAAIEPGNLDKRLIPLKAQGMNEAIPSQGGFLVPQQTAPGILEKVYGTGTLLSLFPRDPVAGNNMTYNLVDETSRADGSRFGGITGYWGSEAGTKSPSKGKFSQLELKLRKVYALCIATDELLEDAAALQGWLTRTVPNELRFKVEDAIINGLGGGTPLGILQSPALLSVTRNDASEIDADDVLTMWSRRYAGVGDYVWLGNQGIFPQLAQMTIGQMPVFMPAGGLSGLPYSTLLGRPYYDIEYAPALGTAGDLMLVSPSQYQMIEKSGGIQQASSIHVYFTTDESAFRFVYRVDGAPTWKTTLTGKDAVTVSPFVVLSATS